MTFKRNLISVFILTICITCYAQTKMQSADIFIEKDGNPKIRKKITVELAITAEEQSRGFMERKTIPEGTGMIFLYKSNTLLRFWMKNTPYPLSIAFIDNAGVIREIFNMIPYSIETTVSSEPMRYALEVPQGMFSRMDINIGDRLSKETVYFLKRKAAGK